MDNQIIRELTLGKYEAVRDLIEKRAKENIEKYRKGTCRIKAIGPDGKPLKNKTVKIRQRTHDFKCGANLFMLDEFATPEENKAYREMFSQYFNLATVPFYWADLEPEQNHPRYEKGSPKRYRRPAPDLCFEYCEEKGILPKLHCLVYDTTRPDWLPEDDVKAQMALYEKRFREISDRYAGRMYEVEVINELMQKGSRPERYSALSDKRDILEWCFSLAKQYFPTETLVINDGDFFRTTGGAGYRDPYFMLIDAAIAKGTPIEKVGFQYHIFCGARKPQEEDILEKENLYDPIPMIEGLDIFSALNLPMEITEITIPTVGEGEEAEEMQAEVLKWFYTIGFSTPLMESMVYWNTVEGTAHTVENNCRAGIFRKDMTPKPAALMLKKLFSEIWRTEMEIQTDETGYLNFSGFYGDYTARINGKTVPFGIHKATKNEHTLIF